MEEDMRRRSSFPYIFALLAATNASLVVAVEAHVVMTPQTWLTGTQPQASPTSWQSPLQGGSQGVFLKNPQVLGATRAYPSKDGFVAEPAKATGHCSSSGASSQGVGCAAFIALSAAVHSVQQ
jgi:hypothetical protein